MELYDNKDFAPMLLSEVKVPFDDKEYLFELKFDGTRTLIYVEPGKILIKNRRGNVLNDTYPELHSIKKLVKRKCIFDGEIVSLKDGKPSFKQLQQRAILKNNEKINYMVKNFPVVFVCYDILYDKKDLTDLPLIERKKYLEKYPDTDFFVKTKYIEEYGKELYRAVRKEDLEGIVAKKIDSKYYIDKRSKEWLKIKNWLEEILYIVGYVDNNSPMASLILARKNKKDFSYVGRVTCGKKTADFKKIIKQKKVQNIFQDYENKDVIFIEPTLKCEVIFLEYTKNKGLRQPIFKGLKN